MEGKLLALVQLWHDHAAHLRRLAQRDDGEQEINAAAAEAFEDCALDVVQLIDDEGDDDDDDDDDEGDE